MLLKVHTTGGSIQSGWDGDDFRDATLLSSLKDFDAGGAASGWSLSQITAFSRFTFSSALVDQAWYGVEQLPWEGVNWSDSGAAEPTAQFDLIGPGSAIGTDYLITLAGAVDGDHDTDYTVEGVTATYNNTNQGTPITPPAPVEITATAVDDGSGNARLRFTVDYAAGSTRYYLSWFTVTEATSSPVISNVTDPVKPGDTLTITGTDLDAVTSTTFAGVSVTPTTQNATTIEFTVPDAYTNGLAFQSQTVQVTDGSTPDSTTTTLNPPTAATFSGTVAGYPPPTGQKDFFDDPTITAVDGDGYIVEDSSGIIAVMNDDGTAEFSTTGSVTVRLHDVSDTTDSSQGTWTDERTVNITEADLANAKALVKALKSNLISSLRRNI